MSRFLVALAAAAGVSCGLIDSSVDDFQLGFPKKPFTVDTAQWNITVMGTFPEIPCSGNPECEAASSSVCTGCTATCGGTTCEAHVPVSLYQGFNLALEASEYQTIDEQAGLSVTVDTMVFMIESNTMNAATPPLNVWMAPITVTDSADPEAKLIGTIVSVPPGGTGEVSVAIDATGRANLAGFMEDFRTPFNVIVGGVVDIRANDPVPMGAMTGWVEVTAHADAI